jgi:CRP-like cAMP-binding protein
MNPSWIKRHHGPIIGEKQSPFKWRRRGPEALTEVHFRLTRAAFTAADEWRASTGLCVLRLGRRFGYDDRAMAKTTGSMRSSVPLSGTPRRFAKESVLFLQGDRARAFFRIDRGDVRIVKIDDQGRRLEVARLGPGEVLGEAVAFVGGRFPFLAEAATDADVTVFPAKAALEAIGRDPTAARFFVDLLARKCLSLSGRVESLGLETVRRRLVRYLLGRCGGERGCLVRLPVSKGELAAQLGTIAETLSRNLKHLQADGLIEVRKAEIRIIDCPALRAELGEF